MAEYIYVGRRRHLVWISVWHVLTLGIYGRVWIYKRLRELDGHDALFLDRRIYLPLLILPIVGPFFVKRRLLLLVQEALRHDATSPVMRNNWLLLVSIVPLLPVFHVLVQSALNHHWRMHTLREELELKRAQLASLQKSRAQASQDAAKALASEVEQRAKQIDDLEQTAKALREARRIEASLRPPRASILRWLSPFHWIRMGIAALRAALPRRNASPAAAADEAARASSQEAPDREASSSGGFFSFLRKGRDQPESKKKEKTERDGKRSGGAKKPKSS